MDDTKYTKKEILDAIQKNWKQQFGMLNDDDKCDCFRGGYFVVGFVSEAIDRIENKSQ